MPRNVGVSPWSLTIWPRSCSNAATISAASGAALFGQLCRLQRMLQLSDRLARVHAAALGGEQRLDVVERQSQLWHLVRGRPFCVEQTGLLLAHHTGLRQHAGGFQNRVRH